MNKSELISTLRIIRFELQRLGRLLVTPDEKSKNQHTALIQHVERLIKELEDDLE